MIASREDLKQYALQALGHPVIEINVADEQLEDRIDEALDYFRLYHYDGIERIYMKHQIKASRMTIADPVGENFDLDEFIVGQTSGAKMRISAEAGTLSSGTEVLVRSPEGPDFIVGETVIGDHSGTTSTFVSLVLGERDKKYIEVDDWIYGITRVIPISQASSSKNLFDLQYQLRLNDLYDLTSTSIIYFKSVMSYLALLDLELNGYPLYRFNRLSNRLYLDINWSTDIPLGDYIVVEAYRALNPAEFNKVWNDTWLKKYVIALFKRQWANNLKKFGNMVLPGGVTINGQQIYEEAIVEIKELEDDLRSKSAPLEFFIG